MNQQEIEQRHREITEAGRKLFEARANASKEDAKLKGVQIMMQMIGQMPNPMFLALNPNINNEQFENLSKKMTNDKVEMIDKVKKFLETE